MYLFAQLLKDDPQTQGVSFSQRQSPLQAIMNNWWYLKALMRSANFWRVFWDFDWVICKSITQQNTNCEETNGTSIEKTWSSRELRRTSPNALITPRTTSQISWCGPGNTGNCSEESGAFRSVRGYMPWNAKLTKSTAERDINFGTCADIYMVMGRWTWAPCATNPSP